jgi:hypothetical protein
MNEAELIASLNGILGHLQRLDRAVVEVLQPPLVAPEIARLTARFPFVLTRELEVLYQWRNGTDAPPGALLQNLSFFPGFYLLSLEEAAQTYGERDGTEQWRRSWFPLFADGAGDFYVVACALSRLDTSEVIGFIHGEPVQTVEYESVTSMMQTLERSYAEGAFFVDEDNALDMDDDLHREIAHRFNPTIEEWQS